jgi:hypothetical protein
MKDGCSLPDMQVRSCSRSKPLCQWSGCSLPARRAFYWARSNPEPSPTPPLRSNRGPAHLQRHHHRNRNRLLPPRPHTGPTSCQLEPDGNQNAIRRTPPGCLCVAIVCSTCPRSVVRSQPGFTRALRPLTWMRNSLKATTRTDPTGYERAVSRRAVRARSIQFSQPVSATGRPGRRLFLPSAQRARIAACIWESRLAGCRGQRCFLDGHEPVFPTSSLPSRTFMKFPMARFRV